MKTIKLKSVYIREIRYRPNDAEPGITVFYDVLDENGVVFGGEQRDVILLSELSKKAQESLPGMVGEVVSHRETGEGLK